jgi:hypothetical protein
MTTNNEQNKELLAEEKPAMTYQHRCGYCGSTQPPVPYEQMYGPGAMGWDCCPDCGGV